MDVLARILRASYLESVLGHLILWKLPNRGSHFESSGKTNMVTLAMKKAVPNKPREG